MINSQLRANWESTDPDAISKKIKKFKAFEITDDTSKQRTVNTCP